MSATDLPYCFTWYVEMTDGIGRRPFCAAHRAYLAGCPRCQIASTAYSASQYRRNPRRVPLTSKPAPAHSVPGALCRCDECWSRMRQIAEGVPS